MIVMTALVLFPTCTPPTPVPGPGGGDSQATSSPSRTARPTPKAKVFAYYYLVWSLRHWRDSLGSQFPYDRKPLPLPAVVDRRGCPIKSRYAGNRLTDVPARLFSQDDPALLEKDVRVADDAGLSGFIVNWAGTGRREQDVDSVSYSLRLEGVVDAVKDLNQEGSPFKLWLQYKAAARRLSLDHILADWAYLVRRYRDHPSFDQSYGGKPIVIWAGSRKYDDDVVRAVVDRHDKHFTIIGDENWRTWTATRAALFEGNTYYWSTQNPYTNEDSFEQLADLARTVRSSRNKDGSRKLWFAPLIPGYSSELAGGTTCVPRYDGRTLKRVFNGNARSDPDAFALISWNEIVEGTYVQPLRRWGDLYLDKLKALLLLDV